MSERDALPGGHGRSQLASRAVATLLMTVTVALTMTSGASGGPDPTFGIGGGLSYGPGLALSVVIDPAGRLLVGDATDGGRVRRILPSSDLDTTFGVQGVAAIGSPASSLALDGAGRIYAGRGSIGPATVHRLTTAGVLDASYGDGGVATIDIDPGFTETVSAVGVDGAGRLLVVGSTTGFTVYLARLTSAGALDASFGNGGVVLTGLGAPGDLALASGGSSYVSGFVSGDAAVSAFDSTGAANTSFGSGGVATVDVGAIDVPQGIALAPDGGIVIAGRTGTGGFSGTGFAARLTPAGTVDGAFGTGGVFVAESLADASFRDVGIRADGKMLAVGNWSGSPGGGLRAFLTPDGRPDDAFAPSGGLQIGPPGSFSVNAAAFDASGRAVTAAAAPGFVVTVSVSRYVYSVPDVTPPVILPFTWSVEATGADGANVTYSPPFAYDDVEVSGFPQCEPASGTLFPIGDTTVACTVSDLSGNVGTGMITVRVRQPSALWTYSPRVIVEAAGPGGSQVPLGVSAVDPLAGTELPVVCDPPDGSLFPIGDTFVTCAATTGSGVTSSRGIIVSVRDTTPPLVTVPSPIVAERTGAQGAAVSFAATAVDGIDGAIPVTCSPASGSTFTITFPAQAVAVSCTAIDSRGNSATESFTVTVVDTTAPVIDTTPIVVEAVGREGAGIAVPYTDAGVTRTTDDCVPSAWYAIGSHLVTCTARDDAGNSASAEISVTVRDTTPPVLLAQGNIVVDAESAVGVIVQYTAVGQDVVDGYVEAVCSPVSGATFPIGDTTVQCSASDTRGNTTPVAGLFTVHVRGAAEQFEALRADTTLRRLVRLLDRIATPLAPSRQTCRLLRRYANVAARRGLADLEARARRIAAVLGCA